MEQQISKELEAIERFEKLADENYQKGKKGRELMVELTKDKKLIQTLGTIEYIQKLADDDQINAEKYFNSLTENQKNVVKKYYDLYKKMEIYSNGEGSESKRDKKFAAFVQQKFN